jgi:hypothetical protein
MSPSTPTDDLDLAFRRAYQVIVDQTELPGDALPVVPLSQLRRPRMRGSLVALAAAALVLTVGGLALLIGAPDDAAGPVERLALVEPPPALGGAPVVQFTQDGEQESPPVPTVDMWIWAADDGRSSSVALFESKTDSDMTTLLGATEEGRIPAAPISGEIVEMILPDHAWYAASWRAGDTWRVAVGFDDAEVRRLVDLIDGAEPSSVDIADRHLVYEGPQIIQLERGTVSGIFYDSPAGEFGVFLLDGQPYLLTTVAPLLFPELTDVVVNDVPAVSGRVGELTWESDSLTDRVILWQVGDEATAVVAGVGLPPELLHEVAEGVRPVTLKEWESIAATAVDTVG